MNRDPYEILGVSRDADDEEIRRAYRRLAKQEHPDTAGGGDDDYFCALNDAYEKLRTEKRRRETDRRTRDHRGQRESRPGGRSQRAPRRRAPRDAHRSGIFESSNEFSSFGGLSDMLWRMFNRDISGFTRGASRARRFQVAVRLSPREALEGVTFDVDLGEEGAHTVEIPPGVRDGDEFVLDGQKTFISGVENADHMLLVARTSAFDSSNPTHGVTLFVVPDPADRDGIDLTPLDVDVPWFEVQYQVDIDGLRLDESQVLGAVDGGLYLLWDTLNTERIAGAASAVGGGLRAIDLAVDYANDRSVFGEKIGAHQAIQHPLADAYSKLVCAQSVTYQAAWKWDEGEDAGMEANVAKLRASEAATEAADRAIQTHGGNGYTPDYEVYDIWQNMRLTQTVPVSNEMVKNFVAEHHLGLPRSY